MTHADTPCGRTVALFEKHSADYARRMALEGHERAVGITPAEREKFLVSGLIKSIAPPMTPKEWEQMQHRKSEVTRQHMKTALPENVAACEEILSHGECAPYGTANSIIKARGADAQTVYKMVYNRRKASTEQRKKHVVTLAQVEGRTQKTA